MPSLPRAAAAVAIAAALIAPPAASKADEPTLLGETFPIEVHVTSHVGLLHWLDSLTAANGQGMTAGKTVEAHRAEYNRRFGRPTREDRQVLSRFVEARKAAAGTTRQAPDAVTRAFFEAGTLGEALDALDALLEPAMARELRATVQHFAPRYERLWNGGQVSRAFLQRVRTDERRAAVAGFLVELAGFYGVPADHDPPPRVHAIPVIDGFGTHAQAVGRHLLIEVRDWEGLSEQLGPLVHETAHFLFERLPAERIEALRRAALPEKHGAAAWDALKEALPTALAQGLACKNFGVEGWSVEQPWYHREEIDAFAKRLLPLVKRTLEAGGRLDDSFVKRAASLF